MSRFVKPFLKAQSLNRRTTPSPFKQQFLETSKEPSIPFPLKESFQPKRINLSHYMNLREGDLVQVLFGKDFGRQGVILKINKRKNTATVEGCNLERKRFLTGLEGNSNTTVLEIPIHVTNLAHVDPVLKRPTRVKTKTSMDGSTTRLCKISGSALPDPVPKEYRTVKQNHSQIENRERSEGPPIKEFYSSSPLSQLQILKSISNKILNKTTS